MACPSGPRLIQGPKLGPGPRSPVTEGAHPTGGAERSSDVMIVISEIEVSSLARFPRMTMLFDEPGDHLVWQGDSLGWRCPAQTPE